MSPGACGRPGGAYTGASMQKRLLPLALSLAASAACAGNYPFPQTPVYPGENLQVWLKPTSADADTVAERAATLRAKYAQWKSDHLRELTAPDGTRYTIVQTPDDHHPPEWGNVGAVSDSRAIAFGMLLAVYMGGNVVGGVDAEQDLFRKLFKTWQTFKSRDCEEWESGLPDGTRFWIRCKLMSAQVPANFDPDKKAPSDPIADLDIALALALAHRQWGSTRTYNYEGELKDLARVLFLEGGYHTPTSQLPTLGDYARSRNNQAGRYAETEDNIDLDGNGRRTDVFDGFWGHSSYSGDWSSAQWTVLDAVLGSFPLSHDPSLHHTYRPNEVSSTTVKNNWLYMTGFSRLSSNHWRYGLVPDFVARAKRNNVFLESALIPADAGFPYTKLNGIAGPDGLLGLDRPSVFNHNGWNVMPLYVAWKNLAWPHAQVLDWSLKLSNLGFKHAGTGQNNWDWARVPTSFNYLGEGVNTANKPSITAALAVNNMFRPSNAYSQKAVNTAWAYMKAVRRGPGGTGWFDDSVNLLAMLTTAKMVWFPTRYTAPPSGYADEGWGPWPGGNAGAW